MDTSDAVPVAAHAPWSWLLYLEPANRVQLVQPGWTPVRGVIGGKGQGCCSHCNRQRCDQRISGNDQLGDLQQSAQLSEGRLATKIHGPTPTTACDGSHVS